MQSKNIVQPRTLQKKSGITRIALSDWEIMRNFVTRRSWYFDDPFIRADFSDPLLKNKLSHGAFMLGFDFHLTPLGPKLIEINTNAGGLTTVFQLSSCRADQAFIKNHFVSAVRKEFNLAQMDFPLQHVAIVDDEVKHQPMYPEMQTFAEWLKEAGLECSILSPSELELKNNSLYFKNHRIDLIYNRLIDFRFAEPSHSLMRNAVLNKTVVVTPHPAAYVRIADKRNFLRLKHDVIPETHLLKERSLDDWIRTRKQWVFKPVTGSASRGVYRGEKISVTKLKSLPSETLVQQYIPPPISEDGTKFDVRIYSYDTEILGLVARHFSGQVMEMHSELSGFKAVLPLHQDIT